MEGIDAFLPYRNEAVELFHALALYHDGEETREALHRLFESLIPYLERPQDVKSYRKWDFDNFKFIVHQLFLYAIAIFVHHRRFESAAHLMRSEYFVPDCSYMARDAMVPYLVMRAHMASLEARNKRLELRRLSLRADLLKERCVGVGIKFRELMQADFILFLRDGLHYPNSASGWWPETLMYASHQYGACEVFARSKSRKFFERTKELLGIDSKEDLRPLLEALAQPGGRTPSWGGESFSSATLLGFEDLASRD